MATLITGAGLIGTAFAREAVARGEAVIFIDPFPRAEYVRQRLGGADFELIEDDIRHLPALVDAVAAHRVETVVHTASRIGHRAAKPLHEGYTLNIEGTRTVVEAVRLGGVRRFVNVSTWGVYDWRRPMDRPVSEDFPRGSGVPYGNFKAAQELILEAYAQVYGFELITLRPANIFGVGHFWAGSSGGEKVRDLVVAGLTGTVARIPEEQTQAFDYVSDRDMGRAVDLAATAPMPDKPVFNIGSGGNVTFDALVGLIREHLPRLQVEVIPGSPPRSREQGLDIRHAEAVLGWRPTPLPEAFGSYVQEMDQAMRQAA